MSARLLRLCGPVAGALLAAAGAFAASSSRPNVLVLITDDQGYGDLGCHGNPVVRTPHLDRLHGESVRFTDFHVAPMCTPTRGQLMTGVDCLRNGAMNVSSGRTLLRREFPTLPELLRTGGYATGLFGKWHLGDNHPFRPEDRGFDEAVWYPSSHIGSVPDTWLNDYFDDTYIHNGRRERFRGYTTDVLFREAMAWMRAQHAANRPFFCYLATAAPHAPHYVPEKYRVAVEARLAAVEARLPKLTPAQRTQLVRFLAMIENLDENVGRLDEFLAATGLRGNTILVFLTDNGSTMGPRYFNAGLRGGKVTLWEGGHRVPLFVRWPAGDLGAPRDEPTLAQVQDLLPTILDLCGLRAAIPARLDGVSLAPQLRGGSAVPDRLLVINYSRMPSGDPPTSASPAREGAAVLWRRWRLLEARALYDLATDPAQERDVAAAHPAVVARMQAHLDAWWAGVRDRIDEPQRIVIGDDAENPTRLTACEWWNVFVDQQAQVRRGELKNGVWHLEVARSGDYEFELRRWPREAALPLVAAAPAIKLADGDLAAGRALPITGARVVCGGEERRTPVTPADGAATFRLPLRAGPATLQTWFTTADDRALCGAYYVQVRRL